MSELAKNVREAFRLLYSTPSLLKTSKALVAAASKVPLIRRANEEPFSTCIGCGNVESQDCADGCWVFGLEVAIQDAVDAIQKATTT